MLISEVYNEDCLPRLRRFTDGYFDLAIVDPPYGLNEHGGKDRGSYATQKNGDKIWVPSPKYMAKDWDNAPPQREYFDELLRVSKRQIIWGVNYFNYPFPSPGRIVWDKVNGGSDQSDCELAYYSGHRRVDLFRYMWAGMFQGKSIKEGHVMQGNKKLNERRIHPTQKPVALYHWLLQRYAKPGDKILDTHLGSQSSRIAAYALGFDFYGWEIDTDYYKAGNLRFNTTCYSPTLFTP